MRILSLTRDYPAENSLISRHEVIHACIKPPQSTLQAQPFIQLPSGKFDIRQVVDQLPWEPDLIQISSSLGVFTQPPAIPVGLERVGCPSLMKLTDSHFRHRPIQSLIEYAKVVGCDYHWTAYDRHHLHFFREAGLANPFWVPGAVSIQPYTVSSTPQKQYDVLFCGANAADVHPRRAALLEVLQDAGVKVTIDRKSYLDSLEAYAQAKIVFNCSLNGDLNRRVFETLMAGGFLITDRLPVESGLPLLFEEGVHLECYASEAELLEKVQYYLAHPEQAEQIARQGQQKLLAEWHPHALEDQLLDIVVKQSPLPALFLAVDDDRVIEPNPTARSQQQLTARIRIYELLHELHRLNRALRLLYLPGENTALMQDLRDLTRLEIAPIATIELLKNQAAHSFQIAMIEAAADLQLESVLDELQKYLTPHALLIVVGQSVKKTDLLIQSRGWNPVCLTESGDGACFTYEKLDPQAQSLSSWVLPVTTPLSFSDRLVLEVKSRVKNLLVSLSAP